MQTGSSLWVNTEKNYVGTSNKLIGSLSVPRSANGNARILENISQKLKSRRCFKATLGVIIQLKPQITYFSLLLLKIVYLYCIKLVRILVDFGFPSRNGLRRRANFMGFFRYVIGLFPPFMFFFRTFFLALLSSSSAIHLPTNNSVPLSVGRKRIQAKLPIKYLLNN